MRSIGLSILCVLFLAPAMLRAEDAPQGVTHDLFDGKTLDGWQVRTCDVRVTDGAIHLKAGNGVLQTMHRYGDFVLDLEWKALDADFWDSGIYFRYDYIPNGAPWPREYQANIRKGLEGNVGGLAGAESTGLIEPGEWNRFKLTVVGSKASMEINGKPAWKADGLETDGGYIAIQSEVKGGGQFLFRKIFITELK